MTFWLSYQGPVDLLYFYQNIHDYVGSDIYGKDSQEVQQYIAQEFKKKGKKLFISAFGDTDFPTDKNPQDVAKGLADWVNAHPFIDGVDIDYEDNIAIQNGKGAPWLVEFTKALRGFLNNKQMILTHAPQAPYFYREYYKDGAYYQVDQEVGNLIDWYNIQFYNQNDNKYDTYESLFKESGKWFYHTSFTEIIENNKVPISKLYLGKPAAKNDANNTGYVDPYLLGQYVKKAKDELKLEVPGYFIWQLVHDMDCKFHDQFFKGYNGEQENN